MEEENKKNQVVTSVGNAWIICRSKSHPGRIYYFNTMSGEAAWNLSEAEIEKAKNRTKILNSPELIGTCPEPKEPPIDSQSQDPSIINHNFTIPRIYNKQIINNRFPTQACSFTQNANVQYGIASLNPVCWKMPDAPTFNSVWDIPPSHQIFISPAVTQELSQATVFNVANLQPQSLSVQSLPMSNRFGENNYGNITPARGFGKYRYKNNNRFQNRRAYNFNTRRLQNNVTINDLRQKLCAKRSTVKNCTRISHDPSNDDPETYENVEEEAEDTSTLRQLNEKVSGNEQSQSKLNLKPLRDLAVLEAKLDRWYIVPDTNVLLSSSVYLGTVIESDEDCYLMVPQYVMTKLQALAFSSEPTKFRARNAIRLLTQRFDAGSAFITSEESSQTENDECTNVFNCCLYLIKGNNHVVLLSNDIDMLKYKYTTNIPIFTIPELKNLLNNEPFQQFNNLNTIPDNDRLIKITVVNDVKRNAEVQNDHEIPSLDSLIKLDDGEYTVLPKSSEDGTQTNDLTVTCKIDAGVQTDHISDTVNTRLGDDTQYDVDALNIMSDTARETYHSNYNNYTYEKQEHGNTTSRKREIKLKRSISNQNSKESLNNTADKKQFKWRRRKTTSDVSNSYTTDKVAQKQKIIPSSTSTCNRNADMHDAAVNADLSLIKSADNICCSNIGGSESSNSVRAYVFDRIIVEETSTSGIISNTESNVDSEIVTTVNQQNWQCKVPEIKNVMFEVTSRNMEEFLKMRCDEWVSRFVQIMEDVLTEILQQEPQFIHNEWLPPWTVREATHCIALKFSSYPDVLDAAYKLSNILKQVSDKRGAITVDLKPTEYMEMYSYGVYMVDTLQDVNNCEDLQIASASLKKLLNDIQNANQDVCQNESYVDYPPKNTSVEPETEQNATNDADQLDIQQLTEKLNSSNYNLRSNKKKIQEQENQEREVKFIRNINIEYSFFNSLKLKKSCSNKVDDTEPVEKSKSVASKTLQTSLYLEEDNQLDYEEDFEYGDEEYNSEDEYYYGKENYEFAEGNLDETLNKDGLSQSDKSQLNNSDRKFKNFVGVLLTEIRETFGKVQTLCEGYYEAINGPENIQTTKRKEMKEKAEKAQLLIEDLCRCLDGILKREKNDHGNSIQNLLKMAQVDDFYLDDNMCAEYKSVITKCKDQAETVLSSIKLIINSIEPKDGEEFCG